MKGCIKIVSFIYLFVCMYVCILCFVFWLFACKYVTAPSIMCSVSYGCCCLRWCIIIIIIIIIIFLTTLITFTALSLDAALVALVVVVASSATFGLELSHIFSFKLYVIYCYFNFKKEIKMNRNNCKYKKNQNHTISLCVITTLGYKFTINKFYTSQYKIPYYRK